MNTTMNTQALSPTPIHATTKEHAIPTWWRRPRIVEMNASELTERSITDGSSLALAAWWKDTVIGSVILENRDRTAVIRDFCIDAAWRGRGVGRRLLRGLLKRARLHLISDVYVLATAADAGFYALRGFRPVDKQDARDALNHLDAAGPMYTLMRRHLTAGLMSAPYNGLTMKL